MTAEEILKIIRDLPVEEREKVFMGIMKDFNHEMMSSPAFMEHATAAMHKHMEKMREGGMDTSMFEAIAKK